MLKTHTVMYMKNEPMIRTQVYLSKEQEQALKSLALTSGSRQSELIREAVDLLLSKKNANQNQWKQALHNIKGIWSGDDNAEERMQTIKKEFDR
jgi:Arc/MetJ-type ribon-helix-helix transcriptional regulator